MKLVKRISYFFVIPIFFLSLGIFIGVWGIRFFYPGSYPGRYSEIPADRADTSEVPESVAVTVSEETLCADTEYVLKETDILRNTSVETSWQIPHKYIGMTRERFLETMNLYAEHPPLSELERGFVGLEVLSFSREKVVVRMDYRYLQPSDGFYLAVCDNEVVVYLEDRSTIYINTGIALDSLPEKIQMQIMDMLSIPDEETLRNAYHAERNPARCVRRREIQNAAHGLFLNCRVEKRRAKNCFRHFLHNY